MKTTTLNRIRAHSPCLDSWEKLLKGLGKTQADDEPLAYATILEICGLDDALWAKRAEPQYNWRLLAVAFARSVQHLNPDTRVSGCLDVAERYAKGLATDEELAKARAAAWAARAAARAAADATADAARATADATADAAWAAARAAADATADAAWAAARAAARAAWDAADATADATADAAWSAAWSAAWAAAAAVGAAARDPAWAATEAAWSAARAAERKEQEKLFLEFVNQ